MAYPGDANIVNTGSWTNQRGIVATGGATVNQSRQYRISTGGVWVLLVIFVLLSGAATTAIVINKNAPADPGLTYVLASSQGICPETTVVLEEGGESLRYYDTDANSFLFTR